MAADDDSEREDDCPTRAVDTPRQWDEGGAEDDHAKHEGPRDKPGEPEALEDLRHFFEEVRALDLLLCRAPGHVVGEHVGQDCLGDRDGETAKEEEAGGKR